MKVSVAVLSAAILASPVLARGRGKSSKGKSAVVEEEPACECVAPFTIALTQYLNNVGTATPIFTVEDAVSTEKGLPFSSPSVVVRIPKINSFECFCVHSYRSWRPPKSAS